MADLDKTIIKNLVLINRNSTNREIDEVTCDGRKIATTAVEYLLDMGHNDIGYVGECHEESRYKGYVDTLMRHDLELNPSYIFETKQTEMAGYEIMEKILKAEDIPTAIYCDNHGTGRSSGCQRKLRGCRIQQLELYHLDIINTYYCSSPDLTVR